MYGKVVVINVKYNGENDEGAWQASVVNYYSGKHG
jgi:hypothetical protein